MTRHEEIIQNAVDRLFDLAEMYAGAQDSEIIGVKLGAHVYNVLVHIDRNRNSNELVTLQELAKDPTKERTLRGVPVELELEDHNAMPVFTFQELAHV